MSRYRGPRFRIIRRLGTLPGLTTKRDHHYKHFDAKGPGQHGQHKPQTRAERRRAKRLQSTYCLRLKQKQKLRFHYHITERQLVNYVKRAKKKTGPTAEILLNLLEMRLDNVVYRMGMARTIPAARQLVSHEHIRVNNQKVSIPSYCCQLKDKISVKKHKASQNLVKNTFKFKFKLNQSKLNQSKLNQSKVHKKNQPSSDKFPQKKGKKGKSRGSKGKFNLEKWQFGSKKPRKIRFRKQRPNSFRFDRNRLVGVIEKPFQRKHVRVHVEELLVVEHYSRC